MPMCAMITVRKARKRKILNLSPQDIDD